MNLLKFYRFKAPFRQGGPNLFVQLREVVTHLHCAQTSDAKWVRRVGGRDVEPEFRDFTGLHPEDFRPSLRMQRAKGGAEAGVGHTNEMLASINWVLWHLMDWSCRLRGEHRLEATHLLVDMLTKVMSSSYPVMPVTVVMPPARDPELCDQAPHDGVGNSCRHCQELLGKRQGVEGVDCSNLARLMVEVYDARHDCKVARQWVGQLVMEVAEVFQDSLCRADAWRQSAMRVEQPRGLHKRRRLDKDLLESAVVAVQNREAFSTSRACASGLVDVDSKQARNHQAQIMMRYMAASLAVCEGAVQLSLATDVSTVGGEATMLGALWVEDKEKALWVPPQATPRRK